MQFNLRIWLADEFWQAVSLQEDSNEWIPEVRFNIWLQNTVTLSCNGLIWTRKKKKKKQPELCVIMWLTLAALRVFLSSQSL